MEPEIFRTSRRVSYADCTLGNHVYYARYFDIFEAARGEFFRQIGEPFLKWQNADVIFPVIEATICFKAPARYDDLLTIEICLSELSKVRMNFSCKVFRGEQLLAEAETKHVCTTLEEKPQRIPNELTEALAKFLRET